MQLNLICFGKILFRAHNNDGDDDDDNNNNKQ